MIAHSKGGVGAFWTRFFTGLDIGNLGVRVFLLLSGFLITSLLLSEFAKTQTISIRNFYFRRVLRIFPAFYTFLAALLILATFHIIKLPILTILRSALYLGDYPVLTTRLPSPHQTWFTVHSWSLAVEEQFYLIWPLLLLKLRPKAAIKAVLLCIVIQPLLRLAVYEYYDSYRPYVSISFEMVSDALATGCLLALTRSTLHAWKPYERLLKSKFTVPLSIAVCLLAYRIKSTREVIWVLAAIPLANFSIALLIDHCITAENIYTRALNLRWIAHLGVLSYSLYLWQEMFLVQGRWASQPWHWFPISWVLALGAACSSYYLVERPFLRLRERLETSGSRKKSAMTEAVCGPRPSPGLAA